jgi:hypothetical protein
MYAFAAGMFSSIAALGSSTASVAQTANRQSVQPSSALPDAIKRAAIATQSEKGRIAGARIGDSNHFVVYIDARGNCGSGGCRAQIWTLDGNRPIRKESIAVGQLPIVLLPGVDNGMPRIGITTRTRDFRAAVVSIAYDGQNYAVNGWDNLLAQSVGRPLITASMLHSY